MSNFNLGLQKFGIARVPNLLFHGFNGTMKFFVRFALYGLIIGFAAGFTHFTLRPPAEFPTQPYQLVGPVVLILNWMTAGLWVGAMIGFYPQVKLWKQRGYLGSRLVMRVIVAVAAFGILGVHLYSQLGNILFIGQ
jgi:hypothetical protein